MPIYEYRCERGHTFEVLQRMADDALSACTTCGAPVRRVFHPVAVHFKGSGFYATDYGRKGQGSDESASKEKSDSKDSKGSDAKSSDSKSSDSKSSDSKSSDAKPSDSKAKSKASASDSS